MNFHKKKPGFVLIMSFVILALIVLLTEQLLRSVYVGSSFIKAMNEREYAEIAALSGINIAIAQLSEHDYAAKSDPAEQAKGSSEKKETAAQLFIKNILPKLNRWQFFKLDQKNDGVDLEVQICLSCEDGKININDVFDFETQAMREDISTLLKGLQIKDKVPAGAFYEKIKDFFTQRKKKIHDISELCTIPEFETLDLSYKPPQAPEKKTAKHEANADIALRDFFTVWSSGSLDAMMLSDSVSAVFELRRPLANDAETMKDKFKQIAAGFDPKMYADVDELWQLLEPLYQHKPRLSAELKGLFSKQFGPAVYSVLSYGRVGNVEQRLLAIVKKVPGSGSSSNDQGKPDPNVDTGVQKNKTDKNDEQKRPVFRVVRLYWL